MRIVGGSDVHRRQITFDYLDERSGQTRRGRIAPANRLLLRRWLETTRGETPAAFAVEACTGWRFLTEELQRAGIEAHLAEPADTAAARGPKRRAKTDRTDARRPARAAGRRPTTRVLDSTGTRAFRCAPGCSWSRTCARNTPPGCSASTPSDCTRAPRRSPGTCSVPTIASGSRPLRTSHRRDGRRSPRRYGSWTPSTPSPLRCASRSPRSPAASPAARRCRPPTGWGPSPRWRCGPNSAIPGASPPRARRCGTPGGTSPSTPCDGKRPPGHLARQGSPLLRWALVEAARPGSPDHASYRRIADRLGGNRATLSVARKIARRAHHTRRALGDEALAAV
jgi:transposase